MAQSATASGDECGICLDALTNPVALPCSHNFCSNCLDSWRSKYGTRGKVDQIGRKCPLCRKEIPPSKEVMAQLKFMRNLKILCETGEKPCTSSEYNGLRANIERLEREVGNWTEAEALDYSHSGEQSMELPRSIEKAATHGHIQTVLDWLGPPPVDKRRINARDSDCLDSTLVFHVLRQDPNFLSILLQYGADVDAVDSSGYTALALAKAGVSYQQARLMLEWGAATTCETGHDDAKIRKLMESEFGGRRCELINLSKCPELNGKTCVVEKHLPDKDRYKIIFEGSKDAALVSPHNLKRRDRTPTDCGYYITFRKGRFSRREFATKEECQTFVAELEAKHAAEELACLNIGSSGSTKGRRGKKGKKKGRK
ncbi:hypothetical protein ACHAXT_007693 [Thalassiosira profunda]